MHKVMCLCSLIVLTSFLSSAWGQDASIIQRAKKATALVEVSSIQPGRRLVGTAFCIDKRGYFVTNYHVVSQLGETGKLNLVLNSGEDNQSETEATILRHDKDTDLAVLRTTKVGAFTPLELGNIEGLIETQSLTAFGYPFGKALANTPGEYPSPTVTVGRITSLRKVRGEVDTIQLDNSLNPGCSGGPVIDAKGTVVGIVQGGIPGAALNFAIPVTRLSSLLQTPEVHCATKVIPYEQRGEACELQLTVKRFLPGSDKYTVEVVIGQEPNTRRFTAKAMADDMFVATVIPQPTSSGPANLPITASYSGGAIKGTVADQELKVGTHTYKLSTVTRIQLGEGGGVVLQTGERLTGPVTGLETLKINVGEALITLDVSKAKTIDIAEPTPAPDEILYRVYIKTGTKTVAEESGTIILKRGPSGHVANRSSIIIREPKLLTDETRVNLPAPVDDATRAGAGRYLLLHMKALSQVGVFDVNEARVIKYIPLPSFNSKLAAGLQKMVIYDKEQRVLQRWNLRTLEQELTVPLDLSGEVLAMAMGSASEGPLLIITPNETIFWSLQTLKKIEMKFSPSENIIGIHSKGTWLNASADGSTFAMGYYANGPRLLTLNGTTVNIAWINDSLGEAYPSDDGTYVLTGKGVYSSELMPVDREQFRGAQCFPTAHSAFFAAFHSGDDIPGNVSKPKMTLHASTDRRALWTLPTYAELSRADMRTYPGGPTLPLSKRMQYIPDAKLLVTVSESRKELILRKLDLMAELNKIGLDYLFVVSLPVRVADRGSLYAYPIEVRSKRGGVTYKLESGPAAMRIEGDGRITWQVPADATPCKVSVITVIRDLSGQEVYHSFMLTVR